MWPNSMTEEKDISVWLKEEDTNKVKEGWWAEDHQKTQTEL